MAITRGGGSVGTIAVDYSIVYLPPGVSDPLLGSSGIVVPAVGSVQIQDSQSSLQFNVPLMSGAFLEEGSSFYVTLDNTTLVGGGETNNTVQHGMKQVFTCFSFQLLHWYLLSTHQA